MINNKKIWEKFEKELIRKTPASYRHNRKIFDELFKEAHRLKALPTKNLLEGIEVKIRIAKAINSVR